MLKLLTKFVHRNTSLTTSSTESNTPSVNTNSSVSSSSVTNTPGNNNDTSLSSSKKVIHPVKALLEEIR